MADLTKSEEATDQQKFGSKEKARYNEGIFGTPKIIEKYNIHGDNSKEREVQDQMDNREGSKGRPYWQKISEVVVNGGSNSKLASTTHDNGTEYSQSTF